MSQNEELLKQLRQLILALAGQDVSEGKPDRAHFLLLLHASIRWLQNPQLLRTTAKEPFQKRTSFFHPFFLLDDETFNEKNIDDLIKSFPDSSTCDNSQLSKLWKEFKEIQSFCRVVLGPKYEKLTKTKNDSGTYTDVEKLREW